MRVKQFANFCQFDRSERAVEQSSADLRLKLLNRSGQGWLSNVQFERGTTEISLISDRDEIAKNT